MHSLSLVSGSKPEGIKLRTIYYLDVRPPARVGSYFPQRRKSSDYGRQMADTSVGLGSTASFLNSAGSMSDANVSRNAFTWRSVVLER